jgi:hypothetical protein
MIAGGITMPYETGGTAAGGAGGNPVSLGGSGAMVTGSGGGEIDGGMPMPFTGGSGGAAAMGGGAGEGGVSVSATGGVAAGGAASPWDGWLGVRVKQAAECVSAGQPLDVHVLVDQAAETLVVTGTRTVVAPPGTEDCLTNYVDDSCAVPEQFAISLSGAAADQVMAAFSYLPEATCTNEGVQCEMPCNAPALQIDGVERGSVFCCGSFDNPEYSLRAQEAVTLLMELVDTHLASQ